MKLRRGTLTGEMEILGVLARHVPTRLVEISLSGCLLESALRIEEGTVGALRLEVQGRAFSDDVRATRCVAIEGSGSSYLIGVEFLRTGRPDDSSIRGAMLNALNGQAPGSFVNVKSEEGGSVMRGLFARLVRSNEGQDLIEYGLLVGIVTIGAIAAIQLIGPKVTAYFTNLNAAMP